ncbi:MAG: hypothetical protein IT481_08410 [Gammaproteobacteria bacterium]|nr:hypothetical protein [Gammaproteobacteria bacterium]
MAIYVCPHCDFVTEFVGEPSPAGTEPVCDDCGAVLELYPDPTAAEIDAVLDAIEPHARGRW